MYTRSTYSKSIIKNDIGIAHTHTRHVLEVVSSGQIRTQLGTGIKILKLH